MNLFYRVVRDAAALLARFPDYDPYVLERHHRQKKDAPSGTARVLASHRRGGRRAARERHDRAEGGLPDGAFHVASVRAGGIVGEHTVGFDSGGDEILLEHRARSRRGFALGAVLAAEWIATRTGFHGFEDVLDDLARRRLVARAALESAPGAHHVDFQRKDDPFVVGAADQAALEIPDQCHARFRAHRADRSRQGGARGLPAQELAWPRGSGRS